MCICNHTCNVRSHAECLRRHPISECSASIPDRRRRPGSAPQSTCFCPPPVRPGPPPACSSSISESSEQLPSIAPRWPHSESLGPGCATTWPAVHRRVALLTGRPSRPKGQGFGLLVLQPFRPSPCPCEPDPRPHPFRSSPLPLRFQLPTRTVTGSRVSLRPSLSLLVVTPRQGHSFTQE